jgi:hypothetical protein
MIHLDLEEDSIGNMLALKADIRPRAVFALVTLQDKTSAVRHKLRLDLGKATFIDHVQENDGFPEKDVKNLTNKIRSNVMNNYSNEYYASPEPVSITQIYPRDRSLT